MPRSVTATPTVLPGVTPHDAGDAAPDQRRNAEGDVGMPADGPANDPVRVGQDVDVEVAVHLEGGQNADIELVDGRALVAGAGVVAGRYPALARMTWAGLSLNDASAIALLYLIARVDDTNMVSRSGLETLRTVQ